MQKDFHMVMTTGLNNYSDVHFTDDEVAKSIISHFNPKGKILDPFRGDGAFYNNLPPGALWCEIDEGKDFFDFHEPVDWIVSNPPYSNLTDVLRHSFTIAENIVYLFPLSKLYSSAPRLRLVRDMAGVKEEFNFGPGRDIGFDIGFPFAAIHFQRGYQGSTKKTWDLFKT